MLRLWRSKKYSLGYQVKALAGNKRQGGDAHLAQTAHELVKRFDKIAMGMRQAMDVRFEQEFK
ncbi:MAG: hypothetical protein GY874_20680 [Desulfobacteraceae bacterium]|nr:hypothetical protein [Desulfobacteraceae bacterium]